MSAEPDVQLAVCQAVHEPVLSTFELPEEQLMFTGLPVEVLPQCRQDPARHPIVILADDVPVGFFVLHEGEGIRTYTDNPRALLLRAFSINTPHQGKGYAKRALRLLPAFAAAHFPHCNEVMLVVNQRNIPAKQLYLACGFVDHGETRIGSIGPQHVLRMPLAQAPASAGT